MLCHELMQLYNGNFSFSNRGLLRGSIMHEPKVRPECQLSPQGLDFIHSGKDSVINDMLGGGDGYPRSHYVTHIATTAFDGGCAIERRDLRWLLVWQQDRNRCLADRKNGRVDG